MAGIEGAEFSATQANAFYLDCRPRQDQQRRYRAENNPLVSLHYTYIIAHIAHSGSDYCKAGGSFWIR
jgi:hypothetical protein